VLRYHAGLSEDEIAAAMGISRGAVNSHTPAGCPRFARLSARPARTLPVPATVTMPGQAMTNRDCPVIRTPGTRRNHNSAEVRTRQFSTRESYFTQRNDLPLFRSSITSESAYLENAPTAQLTRIHAADRLFSVPLTRITSVPECAVSSVGFLWGSAAVSPTCGGSVGLPEAPDFPGRPDTGTRYRNLRRLMIAFPSNPASPLRPARLR
jgi:hypothetical protein